MAMKIKFPLKMADNTQARTLEELREHFDLVSVLRYYDNGKLAEWLADRYYEEEAEKVRALESSAADFKQQLCDILGVSHSGDVDFTHISVRNKRLEHLKSYTADDTILAAIDYVAFTQEELTDLLDKGVQEIYLCGKWFVMPERTDPVTFIGVNDPTVHILEGIMENNMIFKGIRFDDDDLVRLAKSTKDPVEAVAWWTKAAEAHHAEAQYQLALCYEKGDGVEKSPENAVKWQRSAAEQGLPEAQKALGNCYSNGYGVEQNDEHAVIWYRKAAEQGCLEAQNYLGIKYWRGDGVEQSYEEANRWFLQAAERGYHWAQHNLANSYKDGKGLPQDDEEAIKWFQKAADQGNDDAKSVLVGMIDPKLFKLSDVILYAVDGVGNLRIGTKLNAETGKLDISVHDREKVNQEVLRKYGATNVWIETEYYHYQTLRNATFIEMIRGSSSLLLSNKYRQEDMCEDLGEGIVHIALLEICADMEEDFDKNIQSQCSKTGPKKAKRENEILQRDLPKWLES